MYIGARILKTGLAVTFAILICRILKVQPDTFAAITAVVNMQPSVSKALKNAGEQIVVNVVAVVLAIVVGYVLGDNPVIIGLTVVLIIVICIRAHWSGAITLGVLSVVFVLDSQQEEFLTHAVTRSEAIFIGLAVALVINRILAPPKYMDKFSTNIKSLFHDTAAYFLESLHTFIHSTSLSSYAYQEPLSLKTELLEVTELFEHAREEFTAENNPVFAERMLEICRGFIERGQSINEMTAQRVARRQAPDSPVPEGVSQEFQKVLDILSSGEAQLDQQVRRMMMRLKNGHSFDQVEEDQDYWLKFNSALDDWQRKFTGVYYLRAMMEVAVVTTEMRWAMRRLRTVHALLK